MPEARGSVFVENLDEEIVPDADEVYDTDTFIYEALNAKVPPEGARLQFGIDPNGLA